MSEHFELGAFGVSPAPRVVRLERTLPGPIERVWAYLTESELRAKWFAGGRMEQRVGGEVELLHKHSTLTNEEPPESYRKVNDEGVTSKGRITRWEPPRVLAFSWFGEPGDVSEVSFELSEVGDDVRLVLTHRDLKDRREMTDVAGGWHSHFGLLEDVLRGRPIRPFWSYWRKVTAEYENRFPEA